MSYYLVILFFLASCSILGMFKIDKKLEYSLLFISFLGKPPIKYPYKKESL